MRFGPSLIFNPDRLGPQQLDRRDIALIVTAMVVLPAQAEVTGGIVAGRQMPIAYVNVGKRRDTRQRRHPADNAGFSGANPPQLRTTFGRHSYIHRPPVWAVEASLDADEMDLLIGQLFGSKFTLHLAVPAEACEDCIEILAGFITR